MTSTRTDAHAIAFALGIETDDPTTHADRVARILQMAAEYLPSYDTPHLRAMSDALAQIADEYRDLDRVDRAMYDLDRYLDTNYRSFRDEAARLRDRHAQATDDAERAELDARNRRAYGAMTAYRDARRVLDIARGI